MPSTTAYLNISTPDMPLRGFQTPKMSNEHRRALSPDNPFQGDHSTKTTYKIPFKFKQLYETKTKH